MPQNMAVKFFIFHDSDPFVVILSHSLTHQNVGRASFLCFPYLLRGGFNHGHHVPRINYDLFRLDSSANYIMGGGDDAGIKAGDGWLVPGDGFDASPLEMLAGGLNHGDVGVVVRNLGAVFSHQAHPFYYYFISTLYSRHPTFFSS